MDMLTRRGGRPRGVVAPVVIALSCVLTGVFMPHAGATAGDIGTLDQSFSGVTNPPTSDKPQSKLWFNDGLWWATMYHPSSKTWHIYRLDRPTETWVDTGTQVDNRRETLSDALWDGQKLYIGSQWVSISTTESPKASTSGKPARLYRYSYSSGTKTYSLDSGFPKSINNNSSESLTIDKDTTGRIWATWTQVSGSTQNGFTNAVYVNSSATGESWGTPMVLPVTGANPGPDDISGLVAFKSKIGVLWSNHLDDTVYWAVHKDGDPLTTWNGSVAVHGSKQADDHMNLKTIQSDSQGRVVAAVKTSLDELAGAPSSSPQINLLVFKPGTGSWSSTTFGTLADCHTRPIVVLDEENSEVHVFATAPSSGGCPSTGTPGTIYEKVAPLSNPVFASGRGTPVIRDAASAQMNNPTSTKQSVTHATGLVVLAGNTSTHRYWHADLPIAGTAQAPTASFTKSASSGTAPLSVNFTDTSTQSPTSWSWNFGNGSTSTLQNPSVTYASPGTYTVSLTATNAAGSSAPATSTITVNPAPQPPTASFTSSVTSGTAPLLVNFTDTSTQSPTSWAWDFGDGSTSTLQNPSVTYASAGTYTVSLTATNATGSSAPATATITVNPAPQPPTASFTSSVTSGTAPLLVNFTDTSTQSPTSWAWDFGNGSTSTLQNPSVTYASPGSYTVSLTATNATGSSAPVTATITVTAPAPTASFTSSVSSGTAPLAADFTDTSTQSPTSWAWDFGNGTTSTLQNPSVTYASPGTYMVSLTASNGAGASTPATTTITVNPAPQAPTASFTSSVSSGTAPLTVSFTDTSTHGPTSWAWDFGNGATATLQNPSVTYTSPGTYTVSLTATNAVGSSAPATATITVNPAPSGIVRESTSTAVTTVAATGLTIPKPTGTAPGDVLVSCLTLNGSAIATNGAPAGWTRFAAATAISNPHVYGYYKVAGASEPDTYAWGYTSSIVSSGGIARYSGAAGLDGLASTAAGASATTGAVPGVTTTTANTMVVGCMGINSGATTVTITAPTGMTELWDLGGKRQETDDELRAAVGDTASRTWSFSSGREWAGWLVALRPL